MKSLKTYLLLFGLFSCLVTWAQTKKPVYHPCFLLDSVDKRLDFIKANAGKIFLDTFDCKETLLDSISVLYMRTGDVKYLDALNTIKLNQNARVEGLYIDLVKRFLENDFGGFLNKLYVSKGKYWTLERELVATMNMIVDGRPFKQKYMGLFNVEISKAKDAKDSYKAYYLEKLKTKIEEEKY